MRPGNAGASTADGRLQRPSAGAREAVRGWDLSARDPAARRHRQRLHALTHDCHEAKICFSPGYELDGRDPGTITSRPRPGRAVAGRPTVPATPTVSADATPASRLGRIPERRSPLAART